MNTDRVVPVRWITNPPTSGPTAKPKDRRPIPNAYRTDCEDESLVSAIYAWYAAMPVGILPRRPSAINAISRNQYPPGRWSTKLAVRMNVRSVRIKPAMDAANPERLP